ncbi:MAG: amidophosphoribosyltransferase [Bacillota bacterium]|nr:amidophosphoribosyltransferase [Bacillota bacterium]
MREECGVFGIWGHPQAVELTHVALFALQHRGQESAGIASVRDRHLRLHKGMGLVSEVFGEAVLRDMAGEAAVGHVRYSTFGSSDPVNAQPLVIRYHRGMLGLAHNGNLVNAPQLRDELEAQGSIFQTTLDTEVIAHLIARRPSRELAEAVAGSLAEVKGGYALLFLSPGALIGVRDSNGIRPLCLGKLDGAWCLASETCAFDAVGAEFVREVEPGEMVAVTPGGMVSRHVTPAGRPALCVFEYIYFARPDSDLDGLNVHSVRKQLGRVLARVRPVPADLVTGVPDSSVSAATGYAEEAGIAYEVGLVKNRYIGRTFIEPRQEGRARAVRLKLNPLRRVVEGKRVILVDDSIVRGTTSRYIVGLLREAGAREVHLRISSPPYRFPCYYGIDTSAHGELVAVNRGVEEIRSLVEADSLAYLPVEGLAEALGRPLDRYCLACFTGDYVVPVPVPLDKLFFERGRLPREV